MLLTVERCCGLATLAIPQRRRLGSMRFTEVRSRLRRIGLFGSRTRGCRRTLLAACLLVALGHAVRRWRRKDCTPESRQGGTGQAPTTPRGSFAVGTALTGGPPHRSQRALLTHWAPTSGHDAQSLFGIRVQCSMLDDFHQPSVVDGIEESTDVRVEYPVHSSLSCEPCSLTPAGYLPYPLQRISQIRNLGALPWLFPRFPASCPFRVVRIRSLPGAESGT